jgi:acyl carrier protein
VKGARAIPCGNEEIEVPAVITGVTSTIDRLQELPLSERYEALEELVVIEFKATLLMADDEDLPLDESFFDLGFTSLRIAEIKERLEALLGCGVSANVLFNSPTLERLIEHLTDGVLAHLFTPAA